MKTSIFWTLVLAASTLVSCSVNKKELKLFERLSYVQPDGYKDSLLVGTLDVFENRETHSGRKISLHVAVTPAHVRDSLLEPIFVIDGGPGIGVFHQSYFYTEMDSSYRRYHDIVYVDVRGTGNSRPLHCLELQTKSTPQEYFMDPYPQQELEVCIEKYKDSVDFNFYKTKYIVEDLEEVRKWLGYEKINLLGISFGGKVSLMYMDRYPESIHRVVLHAPDAPNIDHVSKRGRYAQRALDKLFDFCASDSLCRSNFPNIRQEFQTLMDRLRTNEVRQKISLNSSTEEVTMRWFPIARKLANMLYQDDSYILIPHIVHEAFLENYIPLFDAMGLTNTQTNYFLAYGMWFSNICGEDIPKATENYDSAEKETFLSDYLYQTRKTACDTWVVDPAEPAAYKRVVSDIPTLVLSGELDPTLPPETGEEIVRGLSNGHHITIPYMGHMFADLSNLECYDNYILAFFDNDNENAQKSDCFNEMKPKPFKISPTKIE